MQDMITKGTGNSRYLKSSIASDTTWEQFLDMFRSGTLPIDLNGLNTAGIAQQGTQLNKANLLTDATATAIKNLGVSTPSTPNEAFNQLVNALTNTNTTVANGVKIQTGSYTGTGTYGASNPCSLTFNFSPIFVIMAPLDTNTFSGNGQVAFLRGARNAISGISSANNWAVLSWSGKTLSWYSEISASGQLNMPKKYYWVAIG